MTLTTSIGSNKFKFIPQPDQMDCGPACLAMITGYLGKPYSVDFFRKQASISRLGVSLLGMQHALKNIGINSHAVKLDVNKLKSFISAKSTKNIQKLPCILHWNNAHFVVLDRIKTKRNKVYYRIYDPEHGRISMTEDDFSVSWLSDSGSGIALFVEPTSDFFEIAPLGNQRLQ